MIYHIFHSQSWADLAPDKDSAFLRHPKWLNEGIMIPGTDFHLNRTGMHICSLINTTPILGLQSHFKYYIKLLFNLYSIKGFREYDGLKWSLLIIMFSYMQNIWGLFKWHSAPHKSIWSIIQRIVQIQCNYQSIMWLKLPWAVLELPHKQRLILIWIILVECRKKLLT